jgi:GDPmannose 4,6-dehydratase
MKRALITGITGQDGSYLTELLLSKGYEVHGVVRRCSSMNTSRIDQFDGIRVKLHYGDVTDPAGLRSIIAEAEPDEVYNLAAQSHVRVSFDLPEHTFDVVATGAVHVFEAVRRVMGPRCRVYQASSSEMFGSSPPPQNEETAFQPVSPYAAAKVAAHCAAGMYRRAHGMHISSGILFNHEGPRRGEMFVTRKVTRAATRIALGLQDKLHLGNLDAERDWGHAADFVEAMWRMLQQDKPDDYVVATGTSHSVRELVTLAFKLVGLDWQKYVQLDSEHLRPAEVNQLCGDARKARERLGWVPRTSFEDLIRDMIDGDMMMARREKAAAAA